MHFNAFKAGYKSTDDLLNRPIFEGVDYVELEWKEEFLDREILPMSYTVFLRRLRRVLLVAGFAVMARPYAFRVGALVEYDGTLNKFNRYLCTYNVTNAHFQGPSRKPCVILLPVTPRTFLKTTIRRNTFGKAWHITDLESWVVVHRANPCSTFFETSLCKAIQVPLLRSHQPWSALSKGEEI